MLLGFLSTWLHFTCLSWRPWVVGSQEPVATGTVRPEWQELFEQAWVHDCTLPVAGSWTPPACLGFATPTISFSAGPEGLWTRSYQIYVEAVRAEGGLKGSLDRDSNSHAFGPR